MQVIAVAVALTFVESLSDHAIAALATYPGSHNLQSLKHISDPAAESLAKHNEELKLGVTDLTPAAAKSLDGHSHSLSLALETLPVELAQILAEKKGSLIFSELAELSNEAASALSKHVGYLGLGGVTSLSESALEVLKNHKTPLNLYGLVHAGMLTMDEWQVLDNGR